MPNREVSFVPIVVNVPVGAILANAIRIALPAREQAMQYARLLYADGYLAAFISGTLTVTIRDLNGGGLIGSLSWTAAGYQTTGILDYRLDSPLSGIAIAPTGLGIGADSCVITIWTIMEF
jgi:hypothetical protein